MADVGSTSCTTDKRKPTQGDIESTSPLLLGFGSRLSTKPGRRETWCSMGSQLGKREHDLLGVGRECPSA